MRGAHVPCMCFDMQQPAARADEGLPVLVHVTRVPWVSTGRACVDASE